MTVHKMMRLTKMKKKEKRETTTRAKEKRRNVETVSFSRWNRWSDFLFNDHLLLFEHHRLPRHCPLHHHHHHHHHSCGRRQLLLKRLNSDDWMMWREIEDLLLPFHLVTQLMSGDKYLTASLVYPYLLRIIDKCNESMATSKCQRVRKMSQVMHDEMRTRWFGDEKREDHFLVASYLDIRVRDLLPPALLKIAKAHFISRAQMVSDPDSNSPSSSSSSTFKQLAICGPLSSSSSSPLPLPHQFILPRARNPNFPQHRWRLRNLDRNRL